jgi:hypothetical protein
MIKATMLIQYGSKRYEITVWKRHKLAIHRTFGVADDGPYSTHGWTVSHFKSGRAIYHFPTQKDANRFVNEVRHYDWDLIADAMVAGHTDLFPEVRKLINEAAARRNGTRESRVRNG